MLSKIHYETRLWALGCVPTSLTPWLFINLTLLLFNIDDLVAFVERDLAVVNTTNPTGVNGGGLDGRFDVYGGPQLVRDR